MYDIRMKSGQRYIGLSASQGCRGYRYNKAYVDKDIDKEIVDCVILPIGSVSILPEKDRVVYFTLNNESED